MVRKSSRKRKLRKKRKNKIKMKSYESFVRYTPKFLKDINYYSKLFSKYDPYRLSYMHKIKIDFLKEPVLFGRCVLKLIELIKEDPVNGDEVLRRMIVKMHYPYPGRKVIEISPQIISDLRENLRYQNLHLRFWNGCLLPGPKVFDYFTKSIKIKGNKDMIEGILMDYWEGKTHDLDILAIDKEIREEKEKALQSIIPEKAKTRIEYLKEQRRKLILSALRTINEFSVFGTYHLKAKDIAGFEDIEEKTVHFPENYYLNKGVHYLQAIYLWSQILKGNLSLEDVLNRNFNEKIRKDLENLKDKFTDAISPVIEVLNDKEKQRYAQGDEYLHNMQYHCFFHRKEGNPIQKTGFFDAGKVCIGREEESKAKLLLSFLLDLEYLEVNDMFKQSLEDKKNLVEDYKTKMPGLESLLIDEEKSLKAFDMISLYELMCHIGKEAQHTTVNRVNYERLINSEIEYFNPLLDLKRQNGFPTIRISLNAYQAGSANKKMKRRLEERIAYILTHKSSDLGYKLTDREKEKIEKLKKVFKQAGVID